ncbi:MAG: AAC(3) family N-acetyltransferase [Eubacteriales bacterium]
MIIEKMAEDLKKLGLKSDDTILMHSSLKSLGHVDGGARSVIETLLGVLSDGTLLMPSLSYATVRPETPVFSYHETPSCVGTISECFRKYPGVIRSMHPTHSVCGAGKYATEIFGRHIESSTPVGKASPFALLPEYDGKVLMLGCGLRPNTSMHGVEELSVPPYLLREEPVEYTLIDADGNELKKKYRVHNFRGVAQRYDRLAEVMDIPHGKVLEAEAYLIDAREMWKKGHEKLKENEMFFVDKM